MPGVLLTGPPGVGKTTAVKHIVDILRMEGARPAGFYTEEARSHGVRVGFAVVDVATGARRTMASAEGGGPRIGKYHVDLDAIAWGLEPVRRGDGNVLVVDEVGPMEMLYPGFMDVVAAAAAGKPFVLTVHGRFASRVAHAVRGDVVTVTPLNRNAIPASVARLILGLLRE